MLDHQYRIAGIDQMVERVEQALNIGQVQARGRLVQNVEIAPTALNLAQLVRQFDALGLATGDRGRRLAQFEIAHAQALEHAKLVRDDRHSFEKTSRFFNRQRQHIGDGFAPIADLQRLFVIAHPFARLTDHFNVGHKLQRGRDQPAPLALFTAPIFGIEAKAPCRITARLAFWHAGE